MVLRSNKKNNKMKIIHDLMLNKEFLKNLYSYNTKPKFELEIFEIIQFWNS